MHNLTENDIGIASKIALQYQNERANASVSGHHVGACLIARHPKTTDIKFFGGCNIELAASFNVHAERTSLIKAVSEGYIEFLAIVVTSKKKATATMCGYCRQDYMYCNPDVRVVVINPDGTVGINERLIDTMKYPYVGRMDAFEKRD